MSNLGLERHLEGRGLRLHRTQVGDRYVVEQMRRTGHNLGGEQSGHIIMTDFATTGDGLLAGLQILAVLRGQERPLSAVGRVFTPLPQRLHNCRLNGGEPLREAAVQRCIEAAQRGPHRPWPPAGAAVRDRAPGPRHGRSRRRGPARRVLR